MDIEHFKYTWKHKLAFLKIEKELLCKNSLSGYLHDSDKLIMYLIPFLDTEWINKFHRSYANHHIQNAKNKKHIQQAIIDWECARITKPDKPLNARETLERYYNEYIDIVKPILTEFGL